MSWNCYFVIFKAKSPIHIGYRQIGILKTTRYYITGRAIWGALTANLTRALFEEPTKDNYIKIGEFVREYLKTTYFYPAIEDEKNASENETDFYVIFDSKKLRVLIPNYTQEGLKFGFLTREKFEQIFVGSFVSTALELNTRAAEEGSLHEFEFIKDKIELQGRFYEVYWVGYVFVKKETSNELLEIADCRDEDIEIKKKDNNISVKFTQIIKSIRIGGERNYGCGNLRLFKFKKEAGKLFKTAELNAEEKLIIKLEKSKPVFSHVEVTNEVANSVEFLGEIEPLVGREWSEQGAGMKISKSIICLVPGTKLEKDTYEVSDYGIWRINRSS